MKIESLGSLGMELNLSSTPKTAEQKKAAALQEEALAYEKRKTKRKAQAEKHKALNEENPFDYTLTFHDELNPKLFIGNRLKPTVKKQLELIAQDFIEDLGVGGLQVKDVRISGSNAAYSYTKHSDLDLHVLADLTKMQDPIYAELFTAKKTLYNDRRKITVQGIPVELYVQDATQQHVSLGEYSIVTDKWIRYPSKQRANFDQDATKAKYEKLAELIKLGIKTRNLSKIQNVLDTIKRYRQAGLDRGGEFGPENLAFKAVRTEGLVTTLFALRDELRGKELSTENMYENIPREKLTPTVTQLAEKYNISRNDIAVKLDAGIKLESAQSSHRVIAREAALTNLGDDIDFYEMSGEYDLLTEVDKQKPYKMPKLRADRDHLIYVIINKITKQRYVGITAMAYNGNSYRTLYRRMQKHLQRARIENKSWGLCASLRKYGPENFTFGLLEIVPGKKPAHGREMELIGKHNPELNTFKAAIKEMEEGSYPTNHFTYLTEIKINAALPPVVYHVTPTANVGSIMSNGLQPTIGPRSSQIPGEKSAIYCFADRTSLIDALMNWLGDQFDDSEELAELEINTEGLKGRYTKHAEFEIAILSPIPAANIKILHRVI